MIKGDVIIANYQKEALLLSESMRTILPLVDDPLHKWTREIIRKEMDVLNQIVELESRNIALLENELKSFDRLQIPQTRQSLMTTTPKLVVLKMVKTGC